MPCVRAAITMRQAAFPAISQPGDSRTGHLSMGCSYGPWGLRGKTVLSGAQAALAFQRPPKRYGRIGQILGVDQNRSITVTPVPPKLSI
jgi:hypothetical protein